MNKIFELSAVPAAALVLLAVVTGCGPSTPEECLDRAMLSASAGEWKGAFKLASRAVKLAPGNIEALVMQSITARRCGKPETAYEAASRAVNLDPSSFAAQYTLGRVCMDDPTRSEEAKRALVNAFKLRRDDRDTLVLLCNLCERDALSSHLTFLTLLRRDPEYAGHPALYNQLGIAYMRIKDHAKARAAFVNAWKFGRNDPNITYNTACFFDRYTNSAQAAAKLYRDYLELSAGDSDAAAPRAAAAARLEALDGARK